MEINTLQELSEKINQEIEITKNLKCCKKYLDNYCGNDWKNFIKFDDIKYNRIELFRNKYFEILLICWDKNQITSIHKHPKNGCIFKTLQGILYEKRYKSLENITEYEQITYYDKIKSSYIDDNIGVHQIGSKNIKSISIHIYSPPLFYSEKR